MPVPNQPLHHGYNYSNSYHHVPVDETDYEVHNANYEMSSSYSATSSSGASPVPFLETNYNDYDDSDVSNTVSPENNRSHQQQQYLIQKRKRQSNNVANKRLLLHMALSQKESNVHFENPGTCIISESFNWGDFPALENILRAHMREYYDLSTNKRQSKAQQNFNNKLVDLVRTEASNRGWVLDSETFDSKKIRDRIRCFFKTRIQNAKKRLNTMLRNPQKKMNRETYAMYKQLFEAGVTDEFGILDPLSKMPRKNDGSSVGSSSEDIEELQRGDFSESRDADADVAVESSEYQRTGPTSSNEINLEQPGGNTLLAVALAAEALSSDDFKKDPSSKKKELINSKSTKENGDSQKSNEFTALNSFTQTREGVWECSRCQAVPFSLRAEVSVICCESSPDIFQISRHQSICKGQRLHLGKAVQAVKGMVQSIPGMTYDIIVHPGFKAIVKVLVGGSDDLVKVFTEGVKAECLGTCLDAGGNIGIWALLPSKINEYAALIAIASFARSDAGISFDILENKYFIEYVEILAPSYTPPKLSQMTC